MSDQTDQRQLHDVTEATVVRMPRPSVSECLVRESVMPVESTIPAGVTMGEWRRQRRGRPRPRPAGECGHLHDTTTRYDHAQKLLTFLLVCPVCGTERELETQDYEPRFERHQATVHRLPVRRPRNPARRAA
jgi:hypothetical protein